MKKQIQNTVASATRPKRGYRMSDARCQTEDIPNRASGIRYPALGINLSGQVRHRGKRGFTLIEIVMIIVIASIAIPTLLLLLGQQTKYGVDAEIRVTEINLAQQLMEQIKSKCWDESKVAAGCTGVGTGSALGIDLIPPGETAGNPTTYDDIDDYIAGVPDVPLAGITYTRTVAVCYVPSGDINDTSTCSTATNYKRISVTVNNPTNSQSVEVVTVATNY